MPCICSLCPASKSLREKLLSHHSHLYGLSELCVCMCVRSEPRDAKHFPQMSQMCDLSPVCVMPHFRVTVTQDKQPPLATVIPAAGASPSNYSAAGTKNDDTNRRFGASVWNSSTGLFSGASKRRYVDTSTNTFRKLAADDLRSAATRTRRPIQSSSSAK